MIPASLPQIRNGVARFFVNRCTIERNANGPDDTDPRGGPLPPDWQAHLSDVACFAWQGASPGEVRTDDLAAVVDQWRVMLALTVDVTAADRISELFDADGNQINTQPIGILSVGWRRTHRLLVLSEVT